MNHSEFQKLAAPLVREIRAHCYRMTGSLADAEDRVQETLLKAWTHLDQFQGRSSFRSWLYRIATNTCLDRVDQHRPRSLPEYEVPPGTPMTPPGDAQEALWLEPFPDALLPEHHAPDAAYTRKESVALALLATIQKLPAKQRAVLLLREVVGMQAEEVAALLDTSVAAVNSALQRARDTMARPADAPRPTDEVERGALRRYIDAWHKADASALVALLRDDATLAMPPMAFWLRGAADIGAFFEGGLFTAGAGAYRGVETSFNGRPAAALYANGPSGWTPLGIVVLEVDAGGRVAALDAFILPNRFADLGLPMSLKE